MDDLAVDRAAVAAKQGGVSFDWPTAAEVRHYLRPLGWEGRFELIRVHSAMGNLLERCYCMEDLCRRLLGRKATEVRSEMNAHGCFVFDRERLVEWVAHAIGDEALAHMLSEQIDRDAPRLFAVEQVKTIIGQRFDQYCAVMERGSGDHGEE